MSEKPNEVHHSAGSDSEKQNEAIKLDNHNAGSDSEKQNDKTVLRKIGFGLIFVIVGFLLSSLFNIFWDNYKDSSKREDEFTNFYNEINYNIRQLKSADDILLGFEDYFKTKYNLIIKTHQDDFPLPIALWSTSYRVELISKDDPIWILVRNVTFRPLLISDVYDKFSGEGFIYKLKNDEDAKFLKKLYSDFQSKVNTLLDVLFAELNNFPMRSKFTGKKELAEEDKKKLEKQKDVLVNKIQEIRKQIIENVERLDDIKNSLKQRTGKNL